MAYDDYAPVTTADDEEERLRRGEYFPPVASGGMDYAPVTPPNGAVSKPTLSPAPAVPVEASPSFKGVSDLAASAPPVVSPQRPKWEDYAPAEPHGWSKFGHIMAGFSKPLNEYFNVRPEKQAEEKYKNAVAEYESPDKEAQQEATTKETTARAGKETAETKAIENPQPKQLTPDEGYIHDLMMGGPNGGPKVNPATGKPYSYAEAYQAMKQSGAEAKPKQPPHVTYDQGIPVSVTAEGKTYDINDPNLPSELKPLVESANRAHSQHTKESADQQARAFNQQNEMFNKHQTADYEKDVRKQYDTARDADERLSRMSRSYEKALKGDQQAMLALLTDHIGMTLGLQKGARITKDILNEATQSQPWLAKIGAKFDTDRGYLSGVTLGPEQMRQMLDLGYEARNRQWNRAFGDSQMYNVAEPPGARKLYGGDKSYEQEFGKKGGGEQNHTAEAKDFGPAPAGMEEGRTGKADDGTPVIVKNGRIVAR